MRPTLEQQRKKYLCEQYPNVIADIICQYAGNQLNKRDSTKFLRDELFDKRLALLNNTDELDAHIMECFTNF